MRADRLVSLVLLLRRHDRLTAAELARELEVSTRTVLRDIEALSVAGVPVYAERGRLGGFSLLPGFRAELTGLNHDEALALLVAGSPRSTRTFGLDASLASALRKVIDALPSSHGPAATTAAARVLVEPDLDLLARATMGDDEIPPAVAAAVRRAVFEGRKLRIHYAAVGGDPAWRTIDPIGLVTTRGRGYLLARRDGEDRTYRLARLLDAEVLDEPADRPDEVDLARVWQERSTRFRTSGDQVVATVRIDPAHLDELAATALAVREVDVHVVEASFQDVRHAEWALWRLALHAEVLAPASLRDALHARATAIAERYRPPQPAGR